VEVDELSEAGTVSIPRHVHDCVLIDIRARGKVVGLLSHGRQTVGNQRLELFAGGLERDGVRLPVKIKFHL